MISLVSQKNLLMEESKGETPLQIHQQMIGCAVEDQRINQNKVFGVQIPPFKFVSNQITRLLDLKEQIQTDLNSQNPNSNETPGFSHYNYSALHPNLRKPTPNSKDRPNTDPLYSFQASPAGAQLNSINNHNGSLIQSSPFSLQQQSMGQVTPSGLIFHSQTGKLLQNNQVSGNDFQINRTLKDGDLGITA